MDQIKNTQTSRAPPDYVTNLVSIVCYFAHSEQSLKGLGLSDDINLIMYKGCCILKYAYSINSSLLFVCP